LEELGGNMGISKNIFANREIENDAA